MHVSMNRLGVLAAALAIGACGTTRVTEHRVERPPAPPPKKVEVEPMVSTQPADAEANRACERAARWVKRAQALSKDGWVQRPWRLLRHAQEACAKQVDAALLQQAKAAMDPGAATPEALRASIKAATNNGKVAEARTLQSKWVAKMEAATGATAKLLHRPAVARVLGMSADASRVVVAVDGETMLIDGTTGLPLRIIPRSGAGAPHMVAIEGDRMLLVAKAEISVRSLSSGKTLQRMSWTDEAYAWAGFVPGGKHIVAVGTRNWHGVVRVYDIATGNSHGEVTARDGRDFGGGVLLPGTKQLAVAFDAKMLVIDLDSVKVARELAIPVPKGTARSFRSRVTSVAAAKNTVAAGLHDGRLLVWQLPSTQPKLDLATGKYRPRVALSDDASQLIAGLDASFSGEVRTIDIKSGNAIKSHPLPDDDIRFAAGAKAALVGGQRDALQLHDAAGKALWPAAARHAEIEAVALSRGLMLTQEMRKGSDRSVRVHGFYRHHVRRFDVEGYRTNVIAISPSGRYAAAIVSREGRLFALHTGNHEAFSTPDASGFPDTLTFGDDKTLRLAFERDATSWSAPYPFSGWKREHGRSGLRGFSGTRLSSTGAFVTYEDGKLVLAGANKTLVDKGLGGAAFSGDGHTLFVGVDHALAWFSTEGQELGREKLACTPARIGVDREAHFAAFTCGDSLRTWSDQGPPRTKKGIGRVEAVQVTPDGALIAVHEEQALGLYRAADLEKQATLTLVDGEPLATAPDGRIAYWSDDPSWQRTAVCRIGDRAYPWELCRDRLQDDALLEVLLDAP